MKKVAVYVCGGLGNQLFQFATLISYCKKNNYKPIFDRKHSGELHTKDLFWDQFPLLQKEVQEGSLTHSPESVSVSKTHRKVKIYQENDAVFTEIPPFVSEDAILLRGYFNNEKYFKEHKEFIINLFRLCILSLPLNFSNIVRKEIGVHIRRGDYLKYQNVFYTLEPEYYRKALQFLQLGYPTTVVTEEIEWAKKNLYFLDANTNYINQSILEDFYRLMTCSHIVIANSTFSWWAAYLNRGAIVIFPLEWFKEQRLAYENKYKVENWIMMSSKNNQELLITLASLPTEKTGSILENLFFQANNEEEELMFKALQLNCLSALRELKEEESKNLARYILDKSKDKTVSSEVRILLEKHLGEETFVNVNLSKIPNYVIAGIRKPIMEKRFKEKNLEPIFIPAVPCEEKSEGCGKAHCNALITAIQSNIFPCVIYEDDILFTPQYREEFKVPILCDAVFIGMSRYGMGGWNSFGIRSHIRATKDVAGFYRIMNMLSAHGILYMNQKHAVKTLELMKACLELKFINDVATSRIQERTNVLCFEKPMVVQDVELAKNHEQKRNNMETYFSMREIFK